jgi:hypothetical protein
MANNKLVRLDLDAYHILESMKEQLNAEKRKKQQQTTSTFSDAVRAMKKPKEMK